MNEPVEYYGLEEHDGILENDIRTLVAQYNKENNTELIYGEEEEGYWSVRNDSDPDYATFHMFVTFDSEYRAYPDTEVERNLIESILDAMEAYAERHGFPDGIRITDDYED